MTIIFAAGTAPVNPPGATPEISLDQLWLGLERKVREPGLFIPVIESCRVLEDDGETVLRDVQFNELAGNAKAQERITHIKPLSSTAGSALETFQSTADQSRVLNIVSTGVNGELLLTFTFEWEHKDIAPGSTEAIEKQKGYQAPANRAAAGTIAAIRKMITEGKL